MRITEELMLKPLRTRSGCKAWIVGYSPEEEYPFIGCYVGINGYSFGGCWSSDGCYISGKSSTQDIISEWKEPAKGEFWTNVYTTRNPSKHRYLAFHSKIEADDYGACNGTERIACIRTTWTEGQFDE